MHLHRFLSGDHRVSLLADGQGGQSKIEVANITLIYAKDLRLSLDSRIIWPRVAQNSLSNNQSQNDL